MNTKISILCLSTIAWMAVGACSKIQDNPIPEQQTISFTATLSSHSGAVTRSTLTDTGSTIVAEWELGDEVLLYYKNNADANVEALARVSAVDGSGNATLVAELENPKNGCDVTLGFPYEHWAAGLDVHDGQNGTLERINALYNVCNGSGTLSVSGSGASLNGRINMASEMCIWKFTFSDGSQDITSSLTQVTLGFGSSDEYVVTPSNWPNQDAYYVAVYAQSDATVTVSVKKPNPPYAAKTLTASKAGITLEAGKFYCSENLVVIE